MNTSIKKSLLRRALLLCLVHAPVAFTSHNTSRYFPLIENTHDYIIKNRSHFKPSFFYVNASTAHRRGGSTGGIPELWGFYDLNNVIGSLQAVNPAASPIVDVTGSTDFVGKSIKFRVDSKISGVGLGLGWEQDLKWCGFQVGAWLPIMSVKTTARYSFNRAGSDPIFNNSNLTPDESFNQELTVDSIRRKTHQLIGFAGNETTQTGFGDLDLHLRWNHIFDHVLLMRSIDINFQAGAIAPTGVTSTKRYPTSLSLAGNGSWGLYGDFISEFELKQDTTVGLILGFMHQFHNKRTVRLSVAQEPTIFSALIGKVKMKPGGTLKVSPYFTLGNLTDGLDFQVRYTYLRHSIDRWEDLRSDKSIPSYLTTGGNIVAQKEDLSKWRSHYITLQVSYDALAAMKCWKFDPMMFVSYDIPIGGNGISKTHQLSMGAQLHF